MNGLDVKQLAPTMDISSSTIVKIAAGHDCCSCEAQVVNDEVLYPPISSQTRMKPATVRRHIHILQTLLGIAEQHKPA